LFLVGLESTMTTLPATLQEAQALDFARDWLKRWQAEFAEGEGRAFLREGLKNLAGHIGPNATLDLMDRAYAGSEDAHLVLVDMINEYTNRHEALPSFLATYNAEFLTGRVVFRSPPGPKWTTNFTQDVCIVLLMVELVRRFDLRPTRNKLQRRRPCAASVAAQATAELGLHRGTEEALGKIWQRVAPSVLYGMIGW
jgi:hypothetical protein